MGEAEKDLVDPEKGQQQQEQQRQSMGEGITSMFSKAGEGITNAIAKAGEGIHATGTTLKDSAKSAGAMVGLGAIAGTKTPPKQKNNPHRAKQEKKFHKGYKPVPREEPKDTNIVGNITKLLPANTFLMFQTLAPLATNDGNCGQTERIMTGAVLMILCSTCMMVCFTDTIQFNGKVYHGLVTRSGLWNPSFKGDPSFVDLRRYEVQLAEFYEARRRYKIHKRNARKMGLPLPERPEEPAKPRGPHVMGSTYTSGNSQYQLNFTDLLHAALSAMAFGTLTMLTNPVSTCFYPNIPSTVVKTLPLLVGFVISAIFAFSPPARNGIAHPLSPKVPSQMDNYKPPDPKGVVHGPSLPPKPPGEGNHGAKPKPDDDDDEDGSSVKRFIGRLFSSSPEHENGPKKNSPPDHHQGLDSVKAFASGIFSRYGHDIQQGASKVMHGLEDDAKEQATQLLQKAAPGVVELSKNIHVPLALQEAAKTVPHEALVAGLVNAGAHPALALAAVQSAAQSAKDAALNQMQQELQSVTSGPLALAGLSKQASFDLTRANSMLQSAGSSLSLPSAQDARDGLFHQAASALQRQFSGLPPTLHPPGSEAAAIALATGQALMQAGFQFPADGLSPQAAAMSAFSQGMGALNLSAANALVKDATALAQQGSKSVTELQDELARQQAAFTQGLNSHMQTLYSPASSAAQSLASLATSGSQTLHQVQDQAAQGTLAAALAAGAARQVGTLLQVGADHGIAEVPDELARQFKAAVALQASSVAQDAAALAQQGSQSFSDAKADLLKQKEILTQEMNTQARELSAPAASVAQDIAALVTQPGPQPTVSANNAQFAESLARGVASGVSSRIRADQATADHFAAMAQQLQQPAASVAIDVASLIHQGTQMPAQLASQASGLTSQALHAAQMQAMLEHFQQPTPQQALGTHETLRNLTAGAGLVIEDVPDAATAAQRAGDRIQRTASQLPSVREEAMAALPSTSQVRAASNEIAASASDAAGQAALATMTRILRSDKPESTEITDLISMEEITSESETELSNRGEFRTNPSSGSSSRSFSSQQQGSGKRKL